MRKVTFPRGYVMTSLAVLAMAVAGCGGDSAGSSASQSGPQGAGPAPPPPPPPAESGQPVVTADLPVWESDPALAEQLGPYENFDAYRIRPPKGYQRMPGPTATRPGVQIFGWAGPPRPDGSRPSVTINLVTPPPEESHATAEDLLDSALRSVKQRRTDWKQLPTESGRIGDLTLLRTSWQGTMAQTPMKMHGVVYAAKDGANLIDFRTQDIEPHHEPALKLGTASILTFAKQ